MYKHHWTQKSKLLIRQGLTREGKEGKIPQLLGYFCMLDIIVYCLVSPLKEPWTARIVPHSLTQENLETQFTHRWERRANPGISSWLIWLGSDYQIALSRSNQYFRLLMEELAKSVCVCVCVCCVPSFWAAMLTEMKGWLVNLLRSSLLHPHSHYSLWSFLSTPNHKTSNEKHGRPLAPKVEDSYSDYK